jgi:sigma-B regulation protein RsbU (phosphoserine phosphatase)
VRDTVEFARLSDGINATVGSLRDAIADEAARNDRDLATAKAIQESALPRSFPPFPEVDSFDIYASMNAAREVGGDFYDFFLLDDDRVCLLIADVSGKGIPASLFMMAAKTEISSNIRAGMDLGIAMQTANWHLCQGNDAGMFVTVWAAVLDYATGELTYVNAAHNPPLLRHGGKWEWLKERCGLFLGTFETAKYREERITLEKGDELFLYTDGVNEAFSVTEEQYGDDRLEEFLSAHADLHPHALVDAMRSELQTWAEGAEQSDDITMLSIEYGAHPEATGSITLEATTENLTAALNLVRSELASRYCPITVQHKVDVALEELYVNVCTHAYAEQGEPGKVRVDYVFNANPNSITVSLTDWGPAFNPLSHDDPSAPTSIDETPIGGLGLLMVKKSTDDLSYLRDGDANVVVFRCSW